METAAENIRDYNEKLLPRTIEWHNPAGGTVGRIVRGLTRVGTYVPGRHGGLSILGIEERSAC